jgi:transcriptional regulator with XRE-family HTH domain
VEPHPIYKRIGLEISKRRKALRLTQQNVADAVGISRPSIANIERGDQRVFFDQIIEIASYLGIPSVDALLNAEMESSAHPSSNSISGARLNRVQRNEVKSILRELVSVR